MLSVTELRGMLGSGGKAATGAGTFSAVVTRVDADGTTWCQVDGLTTPTPCATDMACSVGDVVTVRIADHRATVTGNATSPATDDSTAIVAQSTAEVAQGTAKAAGSDASVARQAASAAVRQASAANAAASEASALANATNQHFWQDSNGASVTEQPQDEYVQQPTGWRKLLKSTGEILTHAVNGVERIFRSDTASGTVIYDGGCSPDALDLESHAIAVFSSNGVQIGKADSGNYLSIGEGNVDIFHSNLQMAHFGYGIGRDKDDDGSGSSTSIAPYYTLGKRLTGSAVGNWSVAEGFETTASGFVAHSEGYQTIAAMEGAHAEGGSSIATGPGSHAEGLGNTASGSGAHAEGTSCEASGDSAHAEGSGCYATGMYSHAEGKWNYATGQSSHAEGNSSRATAEGAHAENGSAATGYCSHSENAGSAAGRYSHAEGYQTVASSAYSHAEGLFTEAAYAVQHVQGQYNIVDSNGIYADIIGNGTSDSARSNCHATKWDGTQEVNGSTDLPIFKYSTLPAESSLPLKPCIVVLTTGEVYLAT